MPALASFWLVAIISTFNDVSHPDTVSVLSSAEYCHSHLLEKFYLYPPLVILLFKISLLGSIFATFSQLEMASRAPNRSDLSAQLPRINATDKGEPNNDLTELSNNPGTLALFLPGSVLLMRHPERIDYLSYEYREISYVDGDEWRVNFAGLHRMILAKLQEELIDMVGKIGANGHKVTKDVLANIEPVLAKYSE
jgi:hypothetical protein